MSETISIAAFTLVLVFVCGWCGWLTGRLNSLSDRIDEKVDKLSDDLNAKMDDLRHVHMAFLLDKINTVNIDQVKLKTQFDTIFNSLGEGLLKFFHRDDDSFRMDEIIDEMKKRLDAESVQMVSKYEEHADLTLEGWLRLKSRIEAILRDQAKPDETSGIFLMSYLFCIHKISSTSKGLEELMKSNE